MQPVIDFHTHVDPRYADLAVEALDRCGISWSVVLAWHDGFGAGVQRYTDAFAPYPGRFVLFGNVDFSRINEPGFGRMAAAQLEEDSRVGVRGLKVYKSLGLTYRKPDGSLWRVNDPELDPIWEKAGALSLPVLIHTADPLPFWEPVNEDNFWNGVLHGEYDWWSYYRKGLPSAQELLAERNEMIARHPGTQFIAPHLGGKDDLLEEAATDLARYANLHYDISARIPDLGRSVRRAARAKEFFATFADRILFGTDAIYDDTNVPTGQQAQILYQPGEIPLNGTDPRSHYVATTVDFFQSHLDFLLTDKIQYNPPFRRTLQPLQIHGLGLDENVADQILRTNAARLLPPLKVETPQG